MIENNYGHKYTFGEPISNLYLKYTCEYCNEPAYLFPDKTIYISEYYGTKNCKDILKIIMLK